MPVEKILLINLQPEEQQAILDLYEKLDEAEDQSKAGNTRPFQKAIADVKARIHAKAKKSD